MNSGPYTFISTTLIFLLCLSNWSAMGSVSDNLQSGNEQIIISFQIEWSDQSHLLELNPSEFLNFMASPGAYFGTSLNKETENQIRNQVSASLSSFIEDGKDSKPDSLEQIEQFHNFSLFVLELYERVPNNPFVLQLFTQISRADFLVSQVSYLSMMSEGDDAKSILDQIRGGIFSLWRFGEIITGLRALYSTQGMSLYFSDIDTNTFINLMREIELFRLNHQFNRNSIFRLELVDHLIKVGRQLIGLKKTPGGNLLYSQLITFVALSFYMVPQRENLFQEIEKNLPEAAARSVNIGSWADSGQGLFGSSINQMLRNSILKSRVEGRIEETTEAMIEIINEIETVTEIYDDLELGQKIQTSESFWYQAVLGFVVGHVAIPARIGEVLLVVAEKNDVAPETLSSLRVKVGQCVQGCDYVIEELHEFTTKTGGQARPLFQLLGQGASLALTPIQWGADQTFKGIKAGTVSIGKSLYLLEDAQMLDSLTVKEINFTESGQIRRCENVF